MQGVKNEKNKILLTTLCFALVIAVGVYVLADAIVITAQVLVDFARELGNKAEPMYLPAFRVGGKLQIIPVPVPQTQAITGIRGTQDFWSIESWARDLCVKASGGAIGPEAHGTGYYIHYHILGHGNSHSFFGFPVGNIY